MFRLKLLAVTNGKALLAFSPRLGKIRAGVGEECCSQDPVDKEQVPALGKVEDEVGKLGSWNRVV
jgi:hypothetical protein